MVTWLSYYLRSQLKGRFVFIFEEGEESNSGIRPMIAALKHDGIQFDVIYGNHVASNVPSGKVFVKSGPIMAGMATLAYHIVGRGGHVSRPDKSVNPVFAAADVLTSISVAWNNQRDLEKLVTLGVTQLEGGKVYNVIPNEVFIGGSLRFFDGEAGKHALNLVKSWLHGKLYRSNEGGPAPRFQRHHLYDVCATADRNALS